MSAVERAMPLPRLHLPGESSNSSLSRSTERSPRSPRRVPSPLRHAEFRPLAMEYANSPPQTSCKYYNGIDDEEELILSEFCARVRTVGYSTIGGKPFMSGKCPQCHRFVKSETQVCTPNATPPPSPWRNTLNNLQSPIRSPIRTSRSPKNGNGDGSGNKTTTSLQSPLRSPFKGSFFGSGNDKDDKKDDTNDRGSESAPSPKKIAAAGAVGPAPRRGLTRSPPRNGEPGRGSPGPWERSRSPAPRSNSPAPRAVSPGPRSRSPIHGGGAAAAPGSSSRGNGNIDARDNSAKPRASSPSPNRRNLHAAIIHSGSSRSPRAERGRSPATVQQGAEKCPLRGGGVSSRPTPRSRSPPAPSISVQSPRGRVTRHSPGRAGGETRGPRSPGPRSPLRSPWKGASFFGETAGDGAREEKCEDEGVAGLSLREDSSSSVGSSSGSSSGSSGRYPATKSRGPLSPGPVGGAPRSPLRVKVDFFDDEEKVEEERSGAATAPAAGGGGSTTPNKKANGGWKSPVRSPFKGLFFGGSPKSARVIEAE